MTRLPCAFALLMALNVTDSFAQKLDAENLAQASGMAQQAATSVEYFRSYCSEKFPDYKANFDVAALSWFDRNADELTASGAVIDAKGRAEYHRIFDPIHKQGNEWLVKVAEQKGVESVCASFVQKWQDGSADFARDTPRTSQFLLGYLETHPVSADAQQWKDNQMGCIKTMLNNGIDLTSAREGCACSTEIQWARLTAAERAQIDRLARAGKSVANYEPLERIAPAIAACFQ